ncbi:MAG: acyl-CoA thioesterase [Pseudanabaena sp. CRU_2_10]|nr:acyl-CoA thioesterase [Pseudanabaena sp. CRU_2_10]
MVETLSASSYDGWFHFPVRVQPHHTDYGGVVWHGSYLTWMEAARVECLRVGGISFAELVAEGIDLPVVNMSLRYHLAVKMGEIADVMARLAPSDRLRLNWEYEIRTAQQLCVTATVSLVAVDRSRGKVLRTMPSVVQEAIARIVRSQSP